jgi:hypothetical protein
MMNVVTALTYPCADVEIKLGPEAGAIFGNVTDAATGKPVNPYYEFARASDPENRMGMSIGHRYRILLPANTDVTFWVAAKDYKTYRYPGKVDVAPKQDLQIDIQLGAVKSEGR